MSLYMALEATKEMEEQVCLETCESGSTAAAMNLETAFLNNCENGLSEWVSVFFPGFGGKTGSCLGMGGVFSENSFSDSEGPLDQARHLPLLPTFFRHPFDRGWLRHWDR